MSVKTVYVTVCDVCLKESSGVLVKMKSIGDLLFELTDGYSNFKDDDLPSLHFCSPECFLEYVQNRVGKVKTEVSVT